MVVVQSRSRRKPSGAKKKLARSKRQSETGSLPTNTKLGERRIKQTRCKGGDVKLRQLTANQANVLDPKTGKFEVVRVDNIVENPANRHFIRRNIITKGTIMETPKGRVRVTNRPGQEGTVNAVLIEVSAS
ncbi:30S ribosomal protein S8e [Candidatus Woesearchaeota archaeon CG1_02_47_18]|nr:MAG: 30S ribosomal protein S8e [Candidatus Woesearchaeota archaeon CG1_02_47_18]HII29635.1 30S ribosomal protein S8e [Candidatus Woesearchaeota archaeon]